MINMHKKYKTRSGQEVRLFCTDRKDNEYPVIGLVYEDGYESMHSWTSTGLLNSDGVPSTHDLIDVLPVYLEPWKWYKCGDHMYCTTPSSKPGWIAVYRYASGTLNSYRADIHGLTYLNEVLPGAVEIPQPKETK
jgi:hypothetical protein